MGEMRGVVRGLGSGRFFSASCGEVPGGPKTDIGAADMDAVDVSAIGWLDGLLAETADDRDRLVEVGIGNVLV